MRDPDTCRATSVGFSLKAEVLVLTSEQTLAALHLVP
jgi:hypothetical protein